MPMSMSANCAADTRLYVCQRAQVPTELSTSTPTGKPTAAPTWRPTLQPSWSPTPPPTRKPTLTIISHLLVPKDQGPGTEIQNISVVGTQDHIPVVGTQDRIPIVGTVDRHRLAGMVELHLLQVWKVDLHREDLTLAQMGDGVEVILN